MASARRTGTAEVVDTYGAGQDYTALATWEAVYDVNNVSATQNPVLECLAAAYDDSVLMNSATNNATYFHIIRPQTGNFHTGIPGTGVRFVSTADAATFHLQDNNIQLQDISAKTTQNSANNIVCFRTSSSSTDCVFIGCMAYDSANAGAGLDRGFGFESDGSKAIDCLAKGNETRGFGLVTASITGYCYNCTSVGNADGFLFTTGTALVCKNCLAHGSSGSDFNGSITMTNCASEDATASGTGARASQTFTFVNAGSNDYHLSASDAGAKGFGTDLSGDATYAFDDDIDRTTISGSWNIGMDWFASVLIPVFPQPFNLANAPNEIVSY